MPHMNIEDLDLSISKINFLQSVEVPCLFLVFFDLFICFLLSLLFLYNMFMLHCNCFSFSEQVFPPSQQFLSSSREHRDKGLAFLNAANLLLRCSIARQQTCQKLYSNLRAAQKWERGLDHGSSHYFLSEPDWRLGQSFGGISIGDN